MSSNTNEESEATGDAPETKSNETKEEVDVVKNESADTIEIVKEEPIKTEDIVKEKTDEDIKIEANNEPAPENESKKTDVEANKMETDNVQAKTGGNENSTAETEEVTPDEGKETGTNIETDKQPVREHPCKHLIDNFEIPPLCLAKVNKVKTKPMNKVPCNFVSTKAMLSELVERLMLEKEIGVAVRYNSLSYRSRLCLILISCKRVNYIIDCIALRPNLHMLGDIFTNPNITKVTCTAAGMLKNLQLDHNLWFVNIFDIKLAMQKLGMKESFKTYIEGKYNVKPTPDHQLNRWNVRPLPENYKVSAIISMHYLVPTYYFLKNKLIEAKLLEPFLRDCNQLCGKVYKPYSLEMTFKDMQYLTPSQVYAIYALEAWRHKIGKKKRKNVNIVLSIAKFKKLINLMPTKRFMIKKKADSPHVSGHIEEIQNIFLEAKKVIGPVNSRFAAGVKVTGDSEKNKPDKKGEKKAKDKPATPASKQQKRQKPQDQKSKPFGLQKTVFKAGRGRAARGRAGKIPVFLPKVFETRRRSRTPPPPFRPGYGPFDNRRKSPPRPFLESRPRYSDRFQSPPRQFRERSRSPLFRHRSPPRNASPFRIDSSREYYRRDSPPFFSRNMDSDRPRQPVWENPPSSRGVWMNDRDSRPDFQSQESRSSFSARRNGFTDSGDFNRDSRYDRSFSFTSGSRSNYLDGLGSGLGYQSSSWGSRAAFVPPLSNFESNQGSGRITYPNYNASRYSNQGY